MQHNAAQCRTLPTQQRLKPERCGHCRRNKDSKTQARAHDTTTTQARAHGAAEPRAKVQHTAMHCITLCPTIKHATDAPDVAAQPRVNCNTLQHTTTHYNTLQHTATHYEGSECRSTPLRMSLYANVGLDLCECRSRPWVTEVASHQLPKRASTNRSLQHTATYCNILQHTATQYRRTERRCKASDKQSCKSSAAQTMIP